MILQTTFLAGETTQHNLPHIDRDASVLEASKLMRAAGTAELLVTHEAGGRLLPLGIVTASDIVTCVVAAELDPALLTAGDITRPGSRDAD
jgi:predicted transcriptional regulator